MSPKKSSESKQSQASFRLGNAPRTGGWKGGCCVYSVVLGGGAPSGSLTTHTGALFSIKTSLSGLTSASDWVRAGSFPSHWPRPWRFDVVMRRFKCCTARFICYFFSRKANLGTMLLCALAALRLSAAWSRVVLNLFDSGGCFVGGENTRTELWSGILGSALRPGATQSTGAYMLLQRLLWLSYAYSGAGRASDTLGPHCTLARSCIDATRGAEAGMERHPAVHGVAQRGETAAFLSLLFF